MRRFLFVSVVLMILSAVSWGHAGEKACFQPDGTPVDLETYREQVRIHNAEVARIRARRRAEKMDGQGRPLVDARGTEIRYTHMAAFEPKPPSARPWV